MPQFILVILGITPSTLPGAILTPTCCPLSALKTVLVLVINYMVVPLTENLEERHQHVTIPTALMRKLRFRESINSPRAPS